MNGFVSGGLTGGFGSALIGSTAGITNPFLRYGADTANETIVDAFADSMTGGKVTPGSVAASFVFNAVTEGISSRGAKGAKADVNTSKPKATNDIGESTFKSSYDIPKNDKGHTRSNLKLGQDVHREYKANEVLDGVRDKEYILPSGKRADFIDWENKTVYELKPNNPVQIRKGSKQLQGYIDELESMTGESWTGVLDTY